MKYFILITALIFSASAHADQLNFLMFGQSNMSGRGDFSHLPTFQNASRIKVYGNDDQWRTGVSIPVDDATNQTDSISNDGSYVGAGPGYSFADTMADYFPNDDIGLVPCPRGGRDLNSFRQYWDKNTLYGNCMRRAKAVGKIDGIIFWQGEKDAEVYEDALYWRERFSNLISNLRSDLGDVTTPVVFVQLNNLSPSGKPYWSDLRGWQGTIEAPNLERVDSTNWQFQSDEVHATTSGYVSAGEDMADAMYGLMQ